MADSMCGPSNALQNFQKHSTVDRTLQQDRLISRGTPSQGFRSAGPNTGVLDHEFEAFQAGQLPLEPGFQPNTFHHAPANMQQAGAPSWASDFQRMNISSAAPQMQQQTFGMHAQQRQDTGGWHQDFARQQMHTPQRQDTGGFQPQSQLGGMQYSQMLGMGSQLNGYAPQPGMSIAQQKQPADLFDEAAFERAFDEAARAEAESMQEDRQLESTHQEMSQEILLDESAEVLMASDDLEQHANELLSQERIGADTIHDPMFEDQDQPRNEDPEELARTAGKLLDSVQHDRSAKFQNSQFMSLMRQFRDREKTVEGDQVVAKNGMDQDMSMEQDQAAQLDSLCDSLAELMFNRQRPFENTPFNVSHLLLLLTQVRVFMKEHPNYRTLPKRPLSASNSTRMGGVEDILAMLSMVLPMMGLNSLLPLTSLFSDRPLPPLPTNPALYKASSEGATMRRVQTYIAACISQDKEKVHLAMISVLPYYVLGEEEKKMDIHFQYAKDILGKYWDVEAKCRKADIWMPGCSVDEVMEFIERGGKGAD